MLPNISIQVNVNTHLKDPNSSELGQNIVDTSIQMMDELGYEHFNFKKLSKQIGSSEASIYRYFESKNKLLLYLTGWYWGWMEYKLSLKLANIENPEERLTRAINLLTEVAAEDSTFAHVSEVKLQRIVIAESPKAYLNKNVDNENKLGVFSDYKRLVSVVSDIILEIDPNYRCPHMLVSTILEGSHLQRHFSEHLPRLTDVDKKEDLITPFYLELAKKALNLK
ncbi:transcriptional regulator [Owenweeksia hongkongensis DSM 17368]|uniref:Transcriptional regulator n=1 Tax=Owenweeksia hongkongensis (strain DSM 17368 / CIP 108786 / JCM 12287 / NRRL B-23963 / UST20020801) TaxID=926562 RepID=G8R080_OWEHD|nr:transcriptional regulator [Owenweeksia hongkongensis DSM 17368]